MATLDSCHPFDASTPVVIAECRNNCWIENNNHDSKLVKIIVISVVD